MKNISIFLLLLFICTSLFSQQKFLSNKWASKRENGDWKVYKEKTVIEFNETIIHFSSEGLSFPFSFEIEKEVNKKEEYIEYQGFFYWGLEPVEASDKTVNYIRFYEDAILVINYPDSHTMMFYLDFNN